VSLPYLLHLLRLLSSSATPALPRRVFFRRSPRVCGTRLSFFHAGAIYLPLITCSLSTLLYVAVSVLRLRPRPREQHPHPHADPRLSADPSTSIVSLRRTHPDRSQLPKSSIRDPTVSLPWDNPAVENANNVGGAWYLFPVLRCLDRLELINILVTKWFADRLWTWRN